MIFRVICGGFRGKNCLFGLCVQFLETPENSKFPRFYASREFFSVLNSNFESTISYHLSYHQKKSCLAKLIKSDFSLPKSDSDSAHSKNFSDVRNVKKRCSLDFKNSDNDFGSLLQIFFF